MDNRNYLNLVPRDLDKHIYRVIDFMRFKQLVEQGQNTLVSPALWDDPFENFILRCPVRLETGEIATANFHDQYFGQCWTLKPASDAMWRIYSPSKDGIRLRTTIRRLAESLIHHTGEWRYVSAFIGRVRYLNETKLKEFADATWHKTDPSHFAQTLLVKRPAFSHESEVRLVFFQREPRRDGQTTYSYPIDVNRLFDQVMCDPRLPVEEYQQLRSNILHVGYRGKVLRSLLYAPPPQFILRF